MKPGPLLHLTYLLTALILGSALPALLSGGSIYRPFTPGHLLPEALGQDLITLFCVPLLLKALGMARKGKQKGLMLWAATAIYLFYVSSIYAFGGVYNYLFPIYVAIAGSSFYGGIIAFLNLDAERFSIKTGRSFPRPGIAVFLVLSAISLYIIWLALSFLAIQEKARSEATVIIVLDMAIILPAFLLSAFWLLRRHPWGTVLGGIMLAFSSILGLSIIAGQAVRYGSGFPLDTGLAGFFVIFTAIAGILFCLFWRAIGEREVASKSAP